MQLSRTHRTTAGGRNWLFAALVATTTAIFGLPVTALAAPAGGTGGVTTGRAGVEALCGTAKKGQSECFALRRTDIKSSRGLRPAADTPDGYGPADLHSAYALPDNGGAGRTVAIVDAFDDPSAEADLALYRQQFGLSVCGSADGCFRKVDQRGGSDYPAPDTHWAGEISLDLDMVAAVAPAAHILLVEADTNDDANLAAAVDEAVALGAQYVSNSYGTGYTSTPGSGEDPAEATVMDPHYNHPGVAVVASSGDDDYGVSYPAASPYVTSVGGTSLTPDSSTRGWAESVWHNSFGGPGSGCSAYEPKPAFQTDTGCPRRSVADVAAVADPETGVAVYQTYGGNGWGVYGGTSASAPIITAVYADAGTPVAGSYPNAYPYQVSAGLNDVSSGANGTCTPAYLCTAVAGYDGPTGLGTPNGTTAFTTGPHGTILGTVRDAGTGAAVSGATVRAGSGTASTDAQGHYQLILPAGDYQVTAAAYGYASATVAATVADGGQVTENFALSPLPSATISGVVTDGSGHNWPLYAKITVAGVPGAPIFTDPVTGHYSVTLPQGQTYQLQVTPAYGGYQSVSRGVPLAGSNVTANIAVPIDMAACLAPGYQLTYTGPTQPFDASTAPAGWTVNNATTGGGWGFTDPHPRGNLTGGTGGFAMIDSDELGSGLTQDTTLTMPVADLSGAVHPDLSFNTDYRSFATSVADVDLSVDAGTTWTNIWRHSTDDVNGPAQVDLALPTAAGKADVRVRFHYKGTWAYWWELDNVFLGDRSCAKVAGGLLVGTVTDANTHAGLVGATVTSVDRPTETATTAATPDDPNLGDGFYSVFSSALGAHPFTASRARYSDKTSSVTVRADAVAQANFALPAGQLTVTPTSLAKTAAWGATVTGTLTLKNTGTAPATATLGEQPGGFQLLTQGGAALNRVHGTFSNHSLRSTTRSKVPATATGAASASAATDGTPAAAPWQAIANYPTAIQDNAVAVDGGKIYSGFGYTGLVDTSALYRFDPDTGAWTPLASAADTREKPAAVFLNGKLYTVGGWGDDTFADPKLEIYDPASNTWSTGASDPAPTAGGSGVALNGKLYVIGGCTDTCGSTGVRVYDPNSDSWSQAAHYPELTAWESCGAITGRIYCTGGSNETSSSQHTYAYDPGTDSWSTLANLPIDLWGSGYVAAGGKLLVSGGATADSTAVTNQGYAYDPGSDSWTALPNANNSLYRGGSACGFYKIGGNPGGQFSPPVANSEVLPGFNDCAVTGDVPWLSESATSVTVQPGKSVKVTVTMNAGSPEITQPGTYSATLAVGTDTPYPVSPVTVTMTVNPPKTWGKITGTVTSAADGSVLAGATVQINSWATSYTLKTDKNGQYALWLDVRNNPLQVIVAKDGYQPQVRTVKIAKGTSTPASFVLKKA